MRILRLTNSTDTHSGVAPEMRATAVVERVVSAAIGEAVESMVRPIWPTPDLPSHVDRWIESFQPDVVFLRAASFWCTYESVPLRIERRMGRFGKPFATAGLRLGDRPWLVNRGSFKFARQAVVRAIGGEPHFTPEQASGVVAEVLRRAVARESTVAVVRGPAQFHNSAGTRAGYRRAQARLRSLDALTAEACRRLHVRYIPAAGTNDGRAYRLEDDLHDTEAAHQVMGELEGLVIAEEWLAACRK